MKNRVIVVGAGPGGLAAAMLLAKNGFRVTVVEKQGRVGGRSGAIEAEGFRFDRGATFFLYPRILQEIFEACGRDLFKEVALARLDPLYDLVFEQGGRLRATADAARMEEEIARLAPADAKGFRPYMAENRKKLELFGPVLQRPFSSWRDLAHPDVLRSLPLLRAQRSLDKDLKRFFGDERVRLAFSFQAKYLGMSPFRCPSLFTILAFMEYEHGVFHPTGGCGAVLERMAAIAGELGAEIRLGEGADEILFDGRQAVGVRTRRGELRADAVVLNADFGHAMQRLVPERLRRRWSDRAIEGKRWSCSTFMMYLGLEGRLDDLAHHTIFLSKDYAQNIAEIEHGAAPPERPSFYVQNPGITDPTLAPPGHTPLYVLVPVANLSSGAIDWAAEQARYRTHVLTQLAKIGITDIARRIRFEKIVTPREWESDMAVYRGATFNLSHDLGQMLHFRPRNRFEDVDGLYLVGGGTHPGSGLPVIFESARISTRLLAADLGVEPLRMRDAALQPALASS